eukprot:gene4034-8032_t
MSNIGFFCVSILVPMCLVLVGGRFLYAGLRKVIIAYDSNNWPTTEGIIISSELLSVNKKKGGKLYKALVNYEFEVDDIPYRGQLVSFDDNSVNNLSIEKDIISTYFVNKTVVVSYLHSNPNICVLDTSVSRRLYELPGLGIIFIIFGAFVGVFMQATGQDGSINEVNYEVLYPWFTFFLGRCLPIIFILIGILSLSYRRNEYVHAIYSKEWPTTKGIIEYSECKHNSKCILLTYESSCVCTRAWTAYITARERVLTTLMFKLPVLT